MGDFLGEGDFAAKEFLRGHPRPSDGCSWHHLDLRLNTSQVETDESLRSVVSLRACQLRFSSNPQNLKSCSECLLIVKLLRGSLPLDVAKKATVQFDLGGESATSAKPTLK